MNKVVLLILSPFLLWSCTLPGDEKSSQGITSCEIPFQLAQEEGSTIAAHETINIIFESSMVVDSLVVGGTAGQAGVTWSTTEIPNDTLSLSPSSLWNDGEDTNISIKCLNHSEDYVDTTLSFNIENAVFVSKDNPLSDDSNPGTISFPKKTVQAGIDAAVLLYTTADVKVAQGTYQSDYHSTRKPVAKLHNGISLLGGYSEDFTVRDTDLYIAILEDNTMSNSGSIFNPNRAIAVSGKDIINNDILIDGFTIKVGGGEFNSAILLSGPYCNPTISNCRIQGRNSGETNAKEVYGIFSSLGASPIIGINTIIDTGYAIDGSYSNYVFDVSAYTIKPDIISDFTLPRYNGGSEILAESSGKVILLSFIDIINGWDWLPYLESIHNNPSIIGISSDVQIIVVIYNYLDSGSELVNGIPYAGAVNDLWIQDKISITPALNGSLFPILIDSSWSSSQAAQFFLEFSNSNDPLFNGSVNTDFVNYIISPDYEIVEKWNANCTINGDPTYFNWMDIGFGYYNFDSTDLSMTEQYIIQRILDLNP